MMSPEQEAEAEAVILALRGVPQIGDTFTCAFEYRNSYRDKPERFRVSCCFKRHVPPPWPDDMPEHVRELLEEMRQKYPPSGHGPDNVPLVVCRCEEAEYVEGVGGCGGQVHDGAVEEPHPADWPGAPRRPRQCTPGHRRVRKDGTTFCPAAGMYRSDEMAGSGLWRAACFIRQRSAGTTGCAASGRRAGLKPLIRRDDD